MEKKLETFELLFNEEQEFKIILTDNPQVEWVVLKKEITMKQTAVEWLANEFYEKLEVKGDGALFNDLVNQAKEMEMKQIIDAFNNGYYQETIGYNASEQYYNETFKNK